jgi:hypothetical protein
VHPKPQAADRSCSRISRLPCAPVPRCASVTPRVPLPPACNVSGGKNACAKLYSAICSCTATAVPCAGLQPRGCAQRRSIHTTIKCDGSGLYMGIMGWSNQNMFSEVRHWHHDHDQACFAQTGCSCTSDPCWWRGSAIVVRATEWRACICDTRTELRLQATRQDSSITRHASCTTVLKRLLSAGYNLVCLFLLLFGACICIPKLLYARSELS